MKLPLVLTAALSAALLSNSALAALAWKNNITISGIYSTPDGGFLLLLPSGTDPVCGPSGNLFYVAPGQVSQTLDGAKNALAITLTALSLGKTINIYYDDAIANCPVQIVWLNP